MKKLCSLIFAFIIIQTGSAQPKILPRAKILYKIKINTSENTTLHKGTLYSVNDSSVVLITDPDRHATKRNSGSEKKVIVSANQIDYILIWKKNRMGRSVLASTCIGGIIGTIVGYSTGNDKTGTVSFNPEEKALTGFIGGAIPGAIIGCFIGSFKIKIPINKNIDMLKNKRDFLARRSALEMP